MNKSTVCLQGILPRPSLRCSSHCATKRIAHCCIMASAPAGRNCGSRPTEPTVTARSSPESSADHNKPLRKRPHVLRGAQRALRCTQFAALFPPSRIAPTDCAVFRKIPRCTERGREREEGERRSCHFPTDFKSIRVVLINREERSGKVDHASDEERQHGP